MGHSPTHTAAVLSTLADTDVEGVGAGAGAGVGVGVGAEAGVGGAITGGAGAVVVMAGCERGADTVLTAGIAVSVFDVALVSTTSERESIEGDVTSELKSVAGGTDLLTEKEIKDELGTKG